MTMAMPSSLDNVARRVEEWLLPRWSLQGRHKLMLKPTLIVLCALAAQAAGADTPESRLLAAAQQEGTVIVYSVLSTRAAQPLIQDFEARYPGIRVVYDGDTASNGMDSRFRAEVGAGAASADVVWSSAMDMQMKLVADGFAATYRSAQAAGLPRWANYRYQAFGTTLEPIVFAFNRRLVTGDDIPRDHAAFARVLAANPERFRGKVTTFDIEHSGVGFMFAVQDQRQNPHLGEVLRSFGAVDYQPGSGTGEMLGKIAAGDYLLGYHMMGAYALSRGRKDLPDLAVVFPRDFTLVLSRIAFVSNRATHPNAARLWLDHLLSARGQAVIGNSLELFPIRKGVRAQYTADNLRRELGASMRPIEIGPGLATCLEPERRRVFLAFWNQAIAAGRTPRASPQDLPNENYALKTRPCR